jgi:hypothetical protein
MSKWTDNEPELLVEKEEKEDEEEVTDLFEVIVVFKVRAPSADDAESDVKWIIDEGIIKVSDEGHEPVRVYDVTGSEPSEVY